MRDLVPCGQCQRHVELGTARCPFCSATLSTTSPVRRVVGQVTRAAVFASVAACGSTKPESTPIETIPLPPTPDAAVDAAVVVAPPDAGQPGMSSLRGRIFEGKTPAAYLRLNLLGGKTVLSTTTDSDGAYVFDKVPLGRYTLDIQPRRPMENSEEREIVIKSESPATVDVYLGARTYHNSPKPYGAPPARRRVV